MENAMQEPGTYVVHQVEGEESVQRKDLLVECQFQGLVRIAKTRATDIATKNQPDSDDGAHVLVSEPKQTITIVLREHGGFKLTGGAYRPAAAYVGQAKFHKDHEDVKSILRGDYTHEGLAKLLRQKRHLFETRKEWEDVYLALNNTQFKVERVMKNTADDKTGERVKNLEEQIVSEKEVLQWNFFYSIYEGEDPIKMLVEENRSIVAGGVRIKVVPFELEFLERTAVKKMIGDTLVELKKYIDPEVIPYIYEN